MLITCMGKSINWQFLASTLYSLCAESGLGVAHIFTTYKEYFRSVLSESEIHCEM